MRILVVLLSILVPFFGYSQDAQEQFILANKAYENQEYQEAIKEYNAVLAEGYESFELHYNLGNAYFKNQQLGKAILHYEKAYKINPEDEDLKFNLNLSRTFLVDQLEELPRPAVLKWWTSFKKGTHSDIWAKWALILNCILALILITRFFSSSRAYKKLSLLLAFLLLAGSVSTLSMAYISDMTVKKEAILIHTNTNIKSAPVESAENLFILHEGIKMEIMDELNGWHKIKLSDGMIGWLPSVDIEEI